MDKKTNFKEFVKNNPSLLKFVKEEKMTWQKFYEMYDLYGENHEVWNEYINKKGTNIFNKVFYGARDFREGMAPIQDYYGWGFIDKTGATMISCQYYNFRWFHEGVAAVKNSSDYWGYIDKEGEIVIPFEYDDAGDFENGKASVKQNGSWFQIYKNNVKVQ